MPVEVIGIDHVYVTVRDLARSRRFYDGVMRVLGYAQVESEIAGLLAPGTTLRKVLQGAQGLLKARHRLAVS